ncbi:hypothetical protein B0H21DRAFT_730026 [Amylocystis lapponica]|nr:hypothetical protein B0H21DRAFT_730026 [Amylocystis lapponica]
MIQMPLQDSKFTLDSSGVAGFFGGDEAVSAMATVHVYEGRKWLGWYNSPGSYEIGKRYGQLAKSRFWDGLFPGVNVDPATLFELNGQTGPKYIAARSGTYMPQTGHCAYLMMKESEEMTPETVQGRVSTESFVTIVELSHIPDAKLHPRLLRTYSGFLAIFPISASFGTCVVSGVFREWYSFAMILLGIVTSGLACFVIGSGVLAFTHPNPALGAPNGDGMLVGDSGIVILKGKEGAVNAITRGRFLLEFGSEPEYRNIGLCSILLTAQFLAQLLLIPQAELFGQLMFLTSLGVSWMYNSYLSSLDRERIQRDILLDGVLKKPSMKKYSLGTRTAMVVFVMLFLRPTSIEKQILEMLPNDTKVWRRWRETLVERLSAADELRFERSDWEIKDFSESERELLKTLYGDAEAAYDGYLHHIVSSPHQRESSVKKMYETETYEA